MISQHVKVTVDLTRVRRNATELKARVRVPVWATIKADAYGLGAARVAEALAPVVDGFCVFALDEAASIDLWRLTGKSAIALGPPQQHDPAAWIAAHVRPAVSTEDEARQLLEASPILCVDTGMQRFAAPPPRVREWIERFRIDEAFTHATRLEHVERLRELTQSTSVRIHAAATALLDEPAAYLDAVRPGLALYRGAVTVTTPLADARRSAGPIGYTGWASETAHHGVILAGYAHGLRPGPVTVNGRRQRITEIGMQSAYVTLDPADRAGDTVTLLGNGITEADVAFAWEVTPHHALLTLATMGIRDYVTP
jgi:alanine racemase